MTACDDEQQIVKLFEDGDRALIAVNVPELERIYADDYVQYDEYGKPSTRQDLIRKLTSGEVRFVGMKSTGRLIRFLRDDVALVHGSEEDQVEREGKREFVRYVYTDVVMKRSGGWEIVASQLARIQ
jgi:ketosteroid isomerase-like protein